MRIGLIGLGRIGAFHARTLTDLPAVEELVVVDAVAGLGEKLAEELGATAVAEPADILAAGVDGVVKALAEVSFDGADSLLLASTAVTT